MPKLLETMFVKLQLFFLSSLTCISCLHHSETTESNINPRSDISPSSSLTSQGSSSSGQSTATGPSSFCENIVPGLETIARGVDITKFDLLHDYGVDASDGFAENLFDFTCRKVSLYSTIY